MLFDYDGRQMDHLPHQQDFDERRGRINPEAYLAIHAAVEQGVEARDSFRALWLSDVVTPDLQKSLIAAAGSNIRNSQAFFEQIVWEVLRNDRVEWVYFHPTDTDDEFGGNYYFRRGPGVKPADVRLVSS